MFDLPNLIKLHMKKLLDSDWLLEQFQFKWLTPVQKV